MAMTDVLIRGVAEDDLARIDERAARVGLSRSEYLRRQITREAARDEGRVSIEDLERVGRLSRDLLDEDVMRDAWS
ncbi:type II toxin-antitoxin system VapB family antitoxin [Microlunatus parietis]|nr:antitoxin [Microlunatus parietis]